MFTKPPAKTGLDKAIDTLLLKMSEQEPYSEEYAKMTDQLGKLYKAKDHESPRRVSPDTWAVISANLAGILLIIHHEKAGVVTSKALGFVRKLG